MYCIDQWCKRLTACVNTKDRDFQYQLKLAMCNGEKIMKISQRLLKLCLKYYWLLSFRHGVCVVIRDVNFREFCFSIRQFHFPGLYRDSK